MSYLQQCENLTLSKQNCSNQKGSDTQNSLQKVMLSLRNPPPPIQQKSLEEAALKSDPRARSGSQVPLTSAGQELHEDYQNVQKGALHRRRNSSHSKFRLFDTYKAAPSPKNKEE